MAHNHPHLGVIDPAIASIIDGELQRQRQHTKLIPSENCTSPAVIDAVGRILTNEYAEGDPRNCYYGDCEYIGQIESLTIEWVNQLFHCEHANVQSHSGSQANMVVYV
ncbi:MAG: serine hydroxymethyltransferase, partial [Puniceicoccales bacterium]|nr:serine hydroxymethyltransferase [Puniceicoccales bacterium]